MSNFIDTIRSRPFPPDPERVIMVGVDPDVKRAGACMLVADVPPHGPTSGVLSIRECTLLRIDVRTERREQGRAIDAARQITDAIDQAFNIMPATSRTIVEVPEVYANRQEDWQVLVSKANAVVLLSLVAGGVLAMLDSESRTLPVLPRHWKGQATKAGTASRDLKILGQHGCLIKTRLFAKGIVQSGPEASDTSMEHALDALGIALHGIELVHLGKWP